MRPINIYFKAYLSNKFITFFVDFVSKLHTTKSKKYINTDNKTVVIYLSGIKIKVCVTINSCSAFCISYKLKKERKFKDSMWLLARKFKNKMWRTKLKFY